MAGRQAGRQGTQVQKADAGKRRCWAGGARALSALRRDSEGYQATMKKKKVGTRRRRTDKSSRREV
jgi:hypothetical protein